MMIMICKIKILNYIRSCVIHLGDLGESIGEGSFSMQAAVLGHVLEGCYYPEGGPIEFARGLVPTIREVGGEVLVKARVEEILVDKDPSRDQPFVRRVRLTNGDVISRYAKL